MEAIHAAFSLVKTAFSQLVHEWAGTTFTAVGVSIAGVFLVRYGFNPRNWRSAVSADRKSGLSPALCVVTILWAFVFLYAIVNAIYQDHISARGKIQILAAHSRELEDAIKGYQVSLESTKRELSAANALNNQYKATELTNGGELPGAPNCSRVNLHFENSDFPGSMKSLVAADGCTNIGLDSKDSHFNGQFRGAVIDLHNAKPATK